MDEFFDSYPIVRPSAKLATINRYKQKRYQGAQQRYLNGGMFECAHCHALVSIDPLLAGVQNRNHCPYCLWSRHMDLQEAGDRLSACRAPMRPAALTLKQSHKKYNRFGQGELMLVHLCLECERTSINRIAADDVAEQILRVFDDSLKMDTHTRKLFEENGILILADKDSGAVHEQLAGKERCSPSVR